MKKKLLLVVTAMALVVLAALSFSSCKKDESETSSASGGGSQSTSVIEPGQQGTKENPYLIKTADDLLDFADKINTREDEDYALSYFRLEADIDMKGVKYIPAGKPVIEVEDGAEVMKGGFSGHFDGNGHKISNLTVTQTMRTSTYYVGLFGYTKNAILENLTLENINYTVISYSGDNSVGAYIGGVAGYSVLTNFVNVKTSGTIETQLMENNPAHIGGIAGQLEVYDKKQAYIIYVRNCRAAVETVVGKFEEGEDSVLENAANGGLVGSISCTNGAVAFVNCSSEGKVYGGEFVGGIVGYSSGSNVSLTNCVNYANVRATAKEVTYAGGIIGSVRGDVIVLDSYSAGNIVGVKASSSFYKSYAGGLFGYSAADDYELTYSAGVTSENSYYSGAVSKYDVLNKSGEKTEKESADKNWFIKTLGFADAEWDYANGKIAPKDYDKSSGSHKLSLYANGALVKEIDKPYDEAGFTIIGALDEGEKQGANIFFDWVWASGTRYRYYVPVVKDIRLEAKYGDVSEISGTYKGISEYHGESDAGILALYNDGTLQWITKGLIGGTYKFDGTHVILSFFNNYGDVAGVYDKANGTVKFTIEHGMSATVDYTFTVANDIKIFGQYVSENGDMLNFTDNTITLFSDNVRSNDGVSASYTLDGNSVVIGSGKLGDYFASMQITLLDNGSLSVKLTGSAYSIDANFARPSTADHEGKKYVDKYYFPYLSVSGTNVIQTNYIIEFLADGSMAYTSKYSTNYGQYYVFGNKFKILYEGNVTTLNYNETENIFEGEFNVGSKRKIAMTPCSEGELKVLSLNYSESEFVAVNDKRAFLVKDGKADFTAKISANGYATGDKVTVNGGTYYLDYSVTDKNNSGYVLIPVGNEEGSYKYNGADLILDGIGNVSGTKSGKYYVYDKLIVVILNDDTIIGFDYTAAKNAGNVISMLTPDNNQGIWYAYRDDKSDPENPVSKKYYKLIIDGYGHIAYMYNRDFEGEYFYNWGGRNGWVNATETSTGIYCEFNENYKVEFNFYYDKQVAYCKNFGALGEARLAKDGYTGTTELPVLPSSVAGMYNGNEKSGAAIVFNLKQDLTGSVKGMPFSALYDGTDTVFFKVDGVLYTFSVSAKTLSYGSEKVSLTRSGNVTEVIPAMFVGTWSGVWSGYGTKSDERRTIKLESDGTMTYNKEVILTAVYNVDKSTITGTNSDGSYIVTMKWDGANKVMSATVVTEYDGSSYTLTCASLTRV